MHVRSSGARTASPRSPDERRGRRARIQLCGRFVADLDGTRIEDALPGRRGRLLFAYLVLNRGRPLPRDELLMAGWGEDAPAEAGNALSVLLSKLRHGLGADRLRGRTEVELLLPHETFIDVEAALEGAHRAESCIAEERWAQAWGPAGIAYHVATRPFLVGLEAPWIDEWRRRLEEVRLRGLECFAAAGLGLSGPALAQAEERARMLTSWRPTVKPGTASSSRRSSGAATSPKRSALTSGYGSCSGKNWGSRPARRCRPFTDGCCFAVPTARPRLRREQQLQEWPGSHGYLQDHRGEGRGRASVSACCAAANCHRT